ncbi:alpha/beta fold hydrolase [Advenella mimigardefordensis]|uniref:Alpha/beta hydrolase fold domain-containing protein n=1 Tax=Advenella mimigardefordensis (strain DSM 17166 / LMG 22922 / DPN7) TaxID=1247726 RepID=W0P8R8_ADVMD|nr:alpha/beta hydrolase [Advenella mimigardefordensis]AHG63229.1 alpha/beta hydrolase fold domain-containing protein [Advenella mimigardefordensis DPN7]
MTMRFRATALALGVMGMISTGAVYADAPALKSVHNGAATISYRAQGNGPLVLLIASTGRGTQEFGPLAERLAQRGYRVLRPEPRGIGGSHGPMDGVSFHDFANDFAAVIRNEGNNAILAGHAYGNWIARTMASDHPELARGVVLVAAGAKTWPKELSEAITMINDPASSREQRLDGLKLAFFAEGSDPEPWLEGWNQAVTQSQRAARKLTNRDDWWAGGKAPMLDLQGGADPFRPQASRDELKNEFGDRVTVKVIDNASHALPAEKPVETADAIADWGDTLKD